MKKLFKLCTVGGMALVIAACGNGEEETDTGEEAATEENNEVEEASSPEDPVSEEEEVESEGAESEDGTEADDTDSEAESGEAVEEDAAADEDATAGEEESKTFVYEEEGSYNELVYYYIGDEVQRQTSLSEIDYEALNVSGEEEARELFEAGSADYSETEGVTHSIEYGEDGIVENLEVDYTEANLAEVAGLEGSEFEEGAEDAQFISMERSEEQVLAGGYELVEE